VAIESLLAVAQAGPALYLNNGVWQSDMKNMADTLFLALRSATGKKLLVCSGGFFLKPRLALWAEKGKK
jgi:hypothetical protein